MLIVISLSAIITGLIYLFGFIFIVYLLEKIVNSLNEFLTIVNTNIPHISGFDIKIFILFFIGAIIIKYTNSDMKEHKNENNETVYRKEWQKLLDIVNLVMIYPLFTFFEKTNIIATNQKIYMLCYAVLFLVIFVFSHYYEYINNTFNTFDKICSIIYKAINVFASIFIIIIILTIYSFIIYIHDFSNLKNIFISIIYYISLIFPTLIYSFIFFPSGSKNQKLKTIISDFIFLLFISIIIGFSPFYNLLIKNGSVFSIHSLILIDIFLMLIISIILLPIKIKKRRNGV